MLDNGFGLFLLPITYPWQPFAAVVPIHFLRSKENCISEVAAERQPLLLSSELPDAAATLLMRYESINLAGRTTPQPSRDSQPPALEAGAVFNPVDKPARSSARGHHRRRSRGLGRHHRPGRCRHVQGSGSPERYSSRRCPGHSL